MNSTIQTREDLSFTQRDRDGRLINWPRYNYGVPGDWDKGIACFDAEIAELAAHDETEAFHAIQFAIVGMGGRCTSLETGFVDRVARAAVIGLRAMRAGADQFAPTDTD